MQSSLLRGMVIVVAFMAAASNASATAINYQAQLVDVGGEPVADGSYPVTFNLYDDLSAGTLLWTESKDVNVTGGMLTTELGSMNPIGVSVFVTESGGIVTPYLEIVFNGETFSPRVLLGAIPNAYVSQSVRGDFTSGPGYISMSETETKMQGAASLPLNFTAMLQATGVVFKTLDFQSNIQGQFRLSQTGLNGIQDQMGDPIQDQLDLTPDALSFRGYDKIQDQIQDQFSFDRLGLSGIQDQMGDPIQDQMDLTPNTLLFRGYDKIQDQIQDQFGIGQLGLTGIQDQMGDPIQDQMDLTPNTLSFRGYDKIQDQIQDQFSFGQSGFSGIQDQIDDQIQDQMDLGAGGLSLVVYDLVGEEIQDQLNISPDDGVVIQDQMQDQMTDLGSDGLYMDDQMDDQFGNLTTDGLTFGSISTAKVAGSTEAAASAIYGATGVTLPTGAVGGYVLTCDGSGVGTWQPASGGGASYWSLYGDVIRTDGQYGIARYGSAVQGSMTSTQLNLGVNSLTSSPYATVLGGFSDTASGYCSMTGGEACAARQPYSFALGYLAKAVHTGSFVFSDTNYFNFSSIIDNEFAVRAVGGARFVTGINGGGSPVAGVQLAAGGGSWSSLSDRNCKENVEIVDGKTVLEKLADIEISTWNYISQDESIRHMGPMAQDFSATFGVGEDDKHITTLDADGVALAAIQELYRQVSELSDKKDKKIEQLESDIDELKNTVAELLAERKQGL